MTDRDIEQVEPQHKRRQVAVIVCSGCVKTKPPGADPHPAATHAGAACVAAVHARGSYISHWCF